MCRYRDEKLEFRLIWRGFWDKFIFPCVVVVYIVNEYAAARNTIMPRQIIREVLLKEVDVISIISPLKFREGGALILMTAKTNRDSTIEGE